MLPALGAMQLFDLWHLADDAQVLLLRGCGDFADIFNHITGVEVLFRLVRTELTNRHLQSRYRFYPRAQGAALPPTL